MVHLALLCLLSMCTAQDVVSRNLPQMDYCYHLMSLGVASAGAKHTLGKADRERRETGKLSQKKGRASFLIFLRIFQP